MKLELKTESESYLKSFSHFLRTIFKFALIIIFCDIALKLGTISRHYQIEFSCNLLSVEKSKPNFKKLSRLSNLKNKQKLWDFCRGFLK